MCRTDEQTRCFQPRRGMAVSVRTSRQEPHGDSKLLRHRQITGQGQSTNSLDPYTAKEFLLGMGIPEWIVGANLEFFQKFSEGGGNKVTGDFEELTGHAPRSYEVFAKDFASVFAGSE